MVKDKRGAAQIAELRRRAQEQLSGKTTEAQPPRTEAESQRILHELQVQQVELEMQNEELRQAREAEITTLKKYTDLYDFAPVGYLTLDRDGVIRGVNLLCASLLGIERSRLIGLRFASFVSRESRPAFADFIGKVLAKRDKEACEMSLNIEGKRLVHLQIEAMASESAHEFHLAVIDITERKQAEELTQVRIMLLEYATGHTLEELLRKTLDEVGRLVDSPIGFYHFVEPDQKTLSLQAWSTLTLDRFCKAEGEGFHYSMDKAGVWVDCVRQRKPVIHNDYASLPDRKGLPEGHAAVIRELVVPILRDDRIVAILGVGNKQREYTEQDVNRVTYLADVAWEIVERKRVEEVLHESERRLREAQKMAQLGYWSWDVRSGIVEWSEEVYNIFHLDPNEFTPQIDSILELSPWPEDHERGRELIRKAMESHEKGDYEQRFLRPDGSAGYYYSTFQGKYDEKGNLISIIGTVLDITERKSAAEKLRLAHQRLRRFVDSNIVGIIIVDRDGRIVEANDYYLQLIGFTREELESGKVDWRAITPPEWLPADEQAIRELHERGACTPYEKEYVRRDGTRVPVFLADALLPGPEGQIAAFALDLTERKKLAEQLRQAQKMESVGTLAGGIAHDFNNILTAIVGYGYLAQSSMEPGDPQRRNIEHMLEGADRAAHLIKDLLLFSRKQVSEKGLVDLNEIVKKVEKFMVRIIGEDIISKIALHGEPIVVYADTHQLEQVLMNLATNARDAMADGGDLTISSERIILGNDFASIHGYGKPGRYALLSISDTGEGMDEATHKKIFEPFFTTKEVGKGTGLGLAVVYGIIKDHEGYINVYSEPGIGTTFKIYLPLVTTEVRGEEMAPELETLARGTETILLAEDDLPTRELISNLLRQEGYTVIEAVDGVDAVKKFMENRETIHLLLSDLIMPKMNGKEAFDEMKVWRPELKAIFASGYAPDVIRQKMSLDSGVALISKPIMPHALLKKLRTFLDVGEK